MSTENVDLITSAQCRGARGLLGLTQPALASKAKLGLSTIVDFERSRRPVSSEAVLPISMNLAWHTAPVASIKINFPDVQCSLSYQRF